MRDTLLTLTYALAIAARRRFWRLRRPQATGVRALLVRGDEVALVRHRAGADPWGLPGGGVRHGEPLELAAAREVAEETGCDARVEALHGVFFHLHDGFANHIVVFRCVALGELRPPRGDLEIADARFFRPDRLPPGTDPGARRRVAEHAAGLSPTFGPWCP